jgi:hypothetical protein
MRKRLLIAATLAVAVAIIGQGCSSLQQRSFGSAWTGLDQASGTVDVSSGTSNIGSPTSLISVVPALAILNAGQSTPVSINHASAPAEAPPKVAVSSSLGGTFDPASGALEGGSFMTVYTAPGTGSGTTEISALVGSESGSCSIQIIPIPKKVYNIQLSPGRITLPQKTATPISVRVTDQDGWPADSAPITLSQTLDGTFEAAQGTLTSGNYTTNFTAGNATGACTISANVDGQIGSATITVIGKTPSTYQINVSPSATTVRQSTTTPISIRVIDQNGIEVSEKEVLLSQSTDCTFDDSKGTLTNGNFSTNFKAGTSTGSCTISALVEGQIGTAIVTVVESPVATPDSFIVEVKPAMTTLGLLQATPITVKVVNQRGSLADGVSVGLANSLDGTFAASTGTTSQGYFSTTFTSGNASGTCTITASANGATGNAVIQVNSGVNLKILPAKTTVQQGKITTVYVSVTDERGGAINGAKVGISSSLGGTFDNTFVDSASGLSPFEYTAPGVAGTDTLTAQALGQTVSVSITVP